jgi:hypothetical protein
MTSRIIPSAVKIAGTAATANAKMAHPLCRDACEEDGEWPSFSISESNSRTAG